MRLTLWYGAMVMVAGLCLVSITYVLFANALHNNITATTDRIYPRSTAKIVQDLGVAATPRFSDAQAAKREEAAIELADEFNRRQLAAETAAKQSLLTESAIALGLVAMLALAGGWLLAGRALRPLHHITATARTVADSTLHERIGWGPDDELKELADTFDAMLARLDRAFSHQRRFVADASHELRTPLAVNRTLLEVAMNRPNASADLRELGGKLLIATTRHEQLLDGLLTLARSDQGLATRTPVDLADIAWHATESAADTVRTSLGPAAVNGDRCAAGAGSPQSRTERAHVQPTRRLGRGGNLSVPRKRGADRQQFRSRVPADLTEAIFEPFRRLGPRTASTGRFGLGLAIVRSVAVAHGGTATAFPREGGGLTVRVVLPTSSSRDRR
ncbi:sensor histidine kinase [Fodinicola feengrottensis]|uniref:sensor histidine kinase n=1 Tax=Fodinicola feengrottensis TaxID=435914 RepID=UPI002442CC35|nr:HAMP domain-containing sensor histidine kinase [Fodinicola feengrottensis]